MRLFVAIWPPEEVVERLAGLPRPGDPAVRWTTPDQWHVTLRFLGEVEGSLVHDLAAALRVAASSLPPVDVELGPTSVRLGRTILALPVRGVDELAAAVGAATAPAVPEHRPQVFRGHLTLARARGRRSVPEALVGPGVAGSWPATSIALVGSELLASGARYTDVVVVPLGA